MKKKIVIFGGTGLFGLNFVNSFRKNYKIIIAYHKKKFFFPNVLYEKLDLDDFLKLEFTLKKIKPHIIINACAKTNLNWCEKNTSNSFIVNALYAERLALLSEKLSSKFIHLSTDQLFSSSIKFSNEKRKKNPLN